AGEAIASLLGMAGLEAIGALHLAEQRVTVRLSDRRAAHGGAEGEALPRVEALVQIRMVRDRRLGEMREIARRDIGAALVGPAVRGTEAAVLEAELLRLLVHQVDEGLLGPGDRLGQHHAGVIARYDDDSVDQILDADLLAR